MKKITDYAELVKAKHALNKTIAPVEDGASMAGSYTSGKQFIRDSVLYSALTSIAAGTAWSSLTLDTDYEVADDVSTQIAAVNQTLTNKDAFIENVLTVQNLLKYSLTSGSTNEVDYTVNPDTTMSVTTTGTTQNNRFIDMKADFSSLKNGETYILSGCPSGGSTNTYLLYLTDGTDYVDVGSGVSFTYDSSKTYTLRFVVYINMSISTPIVFKPMIRLASANDSTKPYAMTNQELTPYAQSQSNPNLLDNPWFTVNQRGQATYNVAGYSVDRWRISNGVTATINADGSISLSSTVQYADFAQRLIFNEFTAKLLGKTVTLSALLSDGTVKKNTFTLPSTRPSSATSYGEFEIASGVSLRLRVWDSSVIYSAIQVTMNDTSATVTLKAVKLELGSVSTLAHDTAPNYATELLKCQRYFVRIGGTERIYLGTAISLDNDKSTIAIKLPTDMRTLSSINGITNLEVSKGSAIPITALDSSYLNNGYLTLIVSSSGTVSGSSYFARLKPNSNIDFVADL